jgi:hypothetical protein
MITLDEPWFYLSADYEQIWLRVEEQPPERPRQTIQDPKMMVTVAWNPLGFHLLDTLPQGNTFNAEYHRVIILPWLLSLRPQVNGRRLITHADNARKCLTFCKENRLRLPVHTVYSPDLAPSDFFLFGQINHYPQGIAFRSREELLAAIHEIVGAILQPTLEGVFRY